MTVSPIRPLKAYVTRLERTYFDPALASINVLNRLTSLIEKSYGQAKNQSGLDTIIDEQVDRFWEWANRKIIDVKEACRVFNRSKSTIYRWIKMGKLAHTEKVHGRWRIAL